MASHVITTQINELSSEQKAYIAGVIDGEGCVTIVKHTKVNDTKHWGKKEYRHFRPVVIVANTNLELVNYLKTTINSGHIYIRQYRGDNFKMEYQYNLSPLVHVIPFLRQILPYLIVKKAQANLILKAYEDGRNFEAYYDEMTMKLNRKGRPRFQGMFKKGAN